ncbi:MAG TPA: class E sortase [Mycobacteriales bacterium]|jgi:sortase A|nr:class E sortase [Mycobacteriales bacterium]
MDATFITPPVPESPRPARRLVGDSLRRPGGRRALSVLSIVLALAGAGMFTWPFATDLWSARIQSKLRTQFDNPAYREAYRLHQIKVGQGLTRIVIPKLKLNVLVVEGTTPAALKAGAGHYVNTPLPGEAGNVAIAGHRTTYGRPFNRLDEMKAGDVVYLDTPFARYEYKVTPAFPDAKGTVANPHPVLPTEFQVVAPPSDPTAHWLTLTTCHPKGSARQRLVLRLQMTAQLPPVKA